MYSLITNELHTLKNEQEQGQGNGLLGGRTESNFRRGQQIFVYSIASQDRLWDPHSLLCNGYVGFFPRG
jgi:hypothetical protein